MNTKEAYESSEYEKKLLVPIFRSEKKPTIWMLNNASRFVYDEDIDKYEEKVCTKKYRNSRESFDNLILKHLEGSEEILSLYYYDEYDRDEREKGTCRLLFNACDVYEEIQEYAISPDRKYKQFCRLFDLNEKNIAELIEIGYILCELIPRVNIFHNEQGYSIGLKTRFELQDEENMVWDMLDNYANNHIFLGLQTRSYDLLSIIGKNKALKDFFDYEVDEKTALRKEWLYIRIRDRLESFLEEFEREWYDLKEV